MGVFRYVLSAVPPFLPKRGCSQSRFNIVRSLVSFMIKHFLCCNCEYRYCLQNKLLNVPCTCAVMCGSGVLT